MKSHVMAALLATLALGAGDAAAQSIGIFADSSATSCNLTSGAFQTFYIVGVNTDQLPTGGFRACEFRVDTDGASFSQGPFHFTTASTIDRWPVDEVGVVAGWETCQGTSGMAVLFRIVGTLQDSADKTFRVVARNPPSGPNFNCPLFWACNDPDFTKICVPGGEAFVDSQRDCTVAVEAATWGGVKSLFKD